MHSLASVDMCSGWVEGVPLLAKSQALVVEALEAMRRQLPFPILGIDSDNDSAFINDTLLAYCQDKGAELTRSRAYRKNDQAWIEQKNGAVIRRFVGHDRYAGVVVGQVLAHLYQAVRLYVNFFQPSFKLLEKEKHGAKIRKCYEIFVIYEKYPKRSNGNGQKNRQNSPQKSWGGMDEKPCRISCREETCSE